MTGIENDWTRTVKQLSLIIEQLRADKAALLEASQKATEKPQEAQRIMRENDFIIDNLEDRWQKLVFTFYNVIVETAMVAEAAIAQAERKEG